jgi:hypothetical protein
MTQDLAMLEAALYQLRSATASLDEMFAAQMRLPVEVLANAVTAAKESMSAATISDVAFALNDVTGVLDQLSASDAERIAPIVTLLQQDVAQLKEATSLPKAVVDGIRAFQGKLKVRSAAIQKQTYRPEGTPEAPLPHEPHELQHEARPLREHLASAGFATPALDGLIDDPSSVRFHSLNEIINELDVIVGG